MAVPKRKKSKCRRDTRRAHDALTLPSISLCKHCGQAKIPHHVCPECGYYGGKKVIEVAEGV